jgi:hypothetical protein
MSKQETSPPSPKPDLAGLDLGALKWRTSSFSSGQGGNCVEVAPVGHGMVVRDSRQPLGPVLAFSRAEWTDFLQGAFNGEFGLPMQ